MARKDAVITIAGAAGDGSLQLGDFLSKSFHSMGLYITNTKDFPSTMRVYYTYYSIRAGVNKVSSRGNYTDILMAFTDEAVEKNLRELRPDSVIVYDSGSVTKIPDERKAQSIGIPMRKVAKEEIGMEVVKNSIAVGVAQYLLGLDEAPFANAYRTQFAKKKGEKVVDANIQALRYGFQKAKEAKLKKLDIDIHEGTAKNTISLTGNEAVGFGAIAAGCRFAAAYPITPASEILEWLAIYIGRFGGVAIQFEDEIASMNAVIGASFCGARPLTSTSGPGLCLKIEAMGLAGISEVPVVIVDCQRPGPSTGMPTKTGQEDINLAIYAGHGDFPRIVLAPNNIEDCFYIMGEAFNLAEQFQCPVIVMSEQAFSQNNETVPAFDFKRVKIDRGKLLKDEEINNPPLQMFKRFAITEDGISPRTVAGQKGGIHCINGNEHPETGHTSPVEEVRIAQMDKRQRKIPLIRKALPKPEKLYGSDKASIALITMGSLTGIAVEAMEDLPPKLQKDMKVICLRGIHPLDPESLEKHLKGVKTVLVAEYNASGQLATYLKTCIRFNGTPIKNILKYTGRPYFPRELAEQIKQTVL